jgi:hypothetical protein
MISPRTGKNTVALIGFAGSTRHLIPWDDKDIEIWGINDAYKVENFMQRWDRWFQLHPLDYLATQDGTPRDLEHIQWLKQKHDFPIYMQKHFREVPSSVKYPIQDVLRLIGRRYMSSSFAYMFGLAWLEGFERIELYGFDMKTFTEYAEQRPNTEYLIGKAEGAGVDVFIPPQSSLCKGPMYAYDDIDLSLRQEMEYRPLGLEADIQNQKNEYHRLDGRAEAVAGLVETYPELKEKAEELIKEAEHKLAQVNNTMGREQAIQELMHIHDEFKNKELKLKEPQSYV